MYNNAGLDLLDDMTTLHGLFQLSRPGPALGPGSAIRPPMDLGAAVRMVEA
ncbi:hypothetical protein LP420_11000 [Massilia sp. B-10]|nr:hypothetical protein LP420_11000 [Massilia sp. B-10]